MDFFDCVMPARNARHGKLYTWKGAINLKTKSTSSTIRPSTKPAPARCAEFLQGLSPPSDEGGRSAGPASVRHAQPVFYNTLMQRIRDALDAGAFASLPRRLQRPFWTGGSEGMQKLACNP